METSQCQWTDEWTNIMWCVRTMENHSVVQRKEIWTHAPTWMDLEDMPSKIRQT